MKILFTANIPSPYRVQFFQELSRYCDLTVLYEKRKASDRNDKWVNEISDKGYREIYLKAVYEKEDSAFCPEVSKYLNKNMFDIFVIGVYSTLTGMWAIRRLKRKKIPYVLNCDGGFPAESEASFKYRLKKYLLGGAAFWLSTGKQSDEYLVHYGADRNKIFQYHFSSVMKEEVLASVLTKEQKEVYRNKLQLQGEKIIVSVGQFIFRKGYDILFKAAKGLPKQWGIYIIGGLPGEEYCRLVTELGLDNIHFVEFKTKPELLEYYCAADCMVLPTREDIWGLVVNEAMAAGLPVVTTNRCVAGLEMVRENGRIVPVEDAEMLREALISVVIDSDGQEMGRKSLEIAGQYTIEHMAEEHAQIFSYILEENTLEK